MEPRERVIAAARRLDDVTADGIVAQTGIDRDVVRRHLSALVRLGALRLVRTGRGRDASVYAFLSKPRALALGPGRGNRRPRRSVPLSYLPKPMLESMARKTYKGFLRLDDEARAAGRMTLQQADNRFQRDPVSVEQAIGITFARARREERAFFEGALRTGHAAIWFEDNEPVGYVLSPLAAGRWRTLVTACVGMARMAIAGLGRGRVGGPVAAAAFLAEMFLADDDLAVAQSKITPGDCEAEDVRKRRHRQSKQGFALPRDAAPIVPDELAEREAAIRAAAEVGMVPRWLPSGHVLFFLRRPDAEK